MLDKTITNSVSAAVAIVIAAGAALATGPGIPRGERMFGRLDADRNGKLTITEIQPKAEKRFFVIDNDADKSVSKAEIELWLNQAMERRRDRMLRASTPTRIALSRPSSSRRFSAASSRRPTRTATAA